MFCLDHSGTKYRIFTSAKWGTAQRAVMAHSVLLLASFVVALPREHNEPSWNTLTIQIPSYVSCKIGFCPVGPQRTGRIFEWAIAQLLCATILDMISTSCAYALLIWRAPLPPQNAALEHARRCRSHDTLTAREGSVFALLIDLISFIFYDAAQWTQESEPHRLRNRNFQNSCYISPLVGLKA